MFVFKQFYKNGSLWVQAFYDEKGFVSKTSWYYSNGELEYTFIDPNKRRTIHDVKRVVSVYRSQNKELYG